MGKMKDVFIDKINQTPDDIDWDVSNQLHPPPNEINLETGKCMWVIKDYKIWAHTYQQALELLPLIESF
jgi:hypothetical protein